MLGDAAGIADPITGEGIYYAIRGAQLAAGVIKKSLNAGYQYLEEYNPVMKRELAQDLVFARRLALILYKMPFVSLKLIESRGKKLLELYIKVVSGEKVESMMRLP